MRRWIFSYQGHGSRKCSCAECHEVLDGGAIRAATVANHNSRRSYRHWECCVDHIGPNDIITAAQDDPELLQAVEALRQQAGMSATRGVSDADGDASMPSADSPDVGATAGASLQGTAWPCPDLSWWDDAEVSDFLEIPVMCVAKVPESLQAQYRAAKLVLLEQLSAARTPQEEMRAWKAVLLIDRLLLWKGFQRGGKGRNQKRLNANQRTVSERLALFWSGQWGALWGMLRETTRLPRKSRGALTPSRIAELVDDGAWRKLLGSLRGGAPLVDTPDAIPALRDLLLERRTGISSQSPPAALNVPLDEFTEAVTRELKDASPHSAAGRDGGRATHWQVGCGDERFQALLAAALLRWVQGHTPPELDEWFSVQSLFAIRKTTGGLRPIAIGTFLRRLGLRALLRCLRKEAMDAVGPAQYALGRSGGADAAFKALALEASTGNDRAVLSVDIKNAYGTVDRSAIQEAIRRRLPCLAGLVDRLAGCSVRNAFDLKDGSMVWMPQGTGVPQGCPMSTLLFCAVVAEVLSRTEYRAAQLGLQVRVIAYADDIYIVGRAADLMQAYETLAEELLRADLRCAGENTRVWCSCQGGFNALPEELRGQVVESLPVLGCTLYHHDRNDPLAAGFGTDSDAMAAVAEEVRRSAASLRQACAMGLNCQVAGGILRYITVGAPQHLLRTRRWSSDALAVYDAAVKEAWEGLLELPLSEQQVALGNLPLREGGAAFGLAAPRASAAFLVGWRQELWGRCSGAPVYTDDGIRRSFPKLAGPILDAKADLVSQAPKLQGSALLDFTKPPPRQLQRCLMQEVTAERKSVLLGGMTIEQRAFIRRGGGPGAGGFLLVPCAGVSPMANGPWRMAFRRRLLCNAAQIVAPQVAETHCSHSGRQGVCGARLEGHAGLEHAAGCKTGGGVVAQHNSLRDVLWDFARAHIDPRALREQRLESLRADRLEAAHDGDLPGDVLDVVFNYHGRRVAIDVAVVGADRNCARTRAAASRDAASADREERDKRRRYSGLSISPCVFEIAGRAGTGAQGIVRAMAAMAGGDERAPELAACLWQRLSVALQTAGAWQLATAYVRHSSLTAAGGR